MADGLTAFLNARLDEKRQLAEGLLAHPPHGVSGMRGIAEQMLREVEAERAILRRYERGAAGDLPEWKAGRELIEAGLAVLLGVLRDLAAVYSDHPDYRQQWAP